MPPNRKAFALGVLVSYLVYSGIAGMAMKATMPGLNPLGVVYIGLTWPVAMTCIAAHADCSPVPPPSIAKYLFTFKDGAPPSPKRKKP